MPKSLQVADAICKLINDELQGVLSCVTTIRASPFAEVAVAPALDRVDSGPMRCYVEPVTRLVNDTAGQDACSDDWASQIAIVVVQRLDDLEKPNQQPGNIGQVRELLAVGETLAEHLLKVTSLKTRGGVARLDKESAEHELFNREWLRQRIYYSQVTLTYG